MGAYTKDFQHIAIGLVTGELVAGAVKAEHKLLRGTVRLRRSCVLSHGVGLLSRDQIVPQETNYIRDALMRSALEESKCTKNSRRRRPIFQRAEILLKQD